MCSNMNFSRIPQNSKCGQTCSFAGFYSGKQMCSRMCFCRNLLGILNVTKIRLFSHNCSAYQMHSKNQVFMLVYDRKFDYLLG